MEIIGGLISGIWILADGAVDALRDRESPRWVKILSALVLFCYAFILVGGLALLVWYISN